MWSWLAKVWNPRTDAPGFTAGLLRCVGGSYTSTGAMLSLQEGK